MRSVFPPSHVIRTVGRGRFSCGTDPPPPRAWQALADKPIPATGILSISLPQADLNPPECTPKGSNRQKPG
jgi:hypothetical protein